MASSFSRLVRRLVRRLDDGRVVYRLNQRAAAVVLSEAEYEVVERLSARNTLVGTVFGLGIGLSMLLGLHLYNSGVATAGLIAVSWVALAFLATFVEKRLASRVSAILEAAPISALDQLSTVQSRLEATGLVATQALRAAPRPVIWGIVLYLGGIVGASLLALWKQIEGKDTSVPDTHPAILVVAAIVSGVCLRAVLRVRGRR